jgi:hypothetical protein
MRLKEYIDEHGIPLERLARKLNISKRTMWSLYHEDPKMNTTKRILEKIHKWTKRQVSYQELIETDKKRI